MKIRKKNTVLAATIGDCVHVAGIQRFLSLCRENGLKTVFLGTGVPFSELAGKIGELRPDYTALSYRLNAESFPPLLAQIRRLPRPGRMQLLFGGTPPAAALARKSGLFLRSFDGTEPEEVLLDFLRGGSEKSDPKKPAVTLPERIAQRSPFPLIRHHYGRPTLKETLAGAEQIAASGVCDILSIGPDQNSQQFFFKPDRMHRAQDGAGGVPLRRPEDLSRIYAATRRGNYPLVRCYAGTEDLLPWARMLHRTIRNAWSAIPLCWYSRLDGRSDRPLSVSIRENQRAIRWHAEKGIPVEINEPHQWSLRGAHDSLTVCMAFLAAWNAKHLGVRHYICQYMTDTPARLSPSMDLAKMLAQKEMVSSLASPRFRIHTMIRAGLASLAADPGTAKGQLSASTVLGMALRPEIVHVVGFSEADHAVTADELIESCRIVRGAIGKSLRDWPDMTLDPAVRKRKNTILREAKTILTALDRTGSRTDPEVLARAVRSGLFDAPDLAGNPEAKGRIATTITGGTCRPADPCTGRVLTESERIRRLGTGS